MSEPVLTVANQLTMLRMALVPLLVMLALGRQFTWALVVFVVAGLTDALDGYVARHGHQSTTLGAMLDPIADKMLVGSTYAVMTWSSVVTCPMPVWLTVTLLFRDVMLVVGVLLVNLTSGVRVYPPSRLGQGLHLPERGHRGGGPGRQRGRGVPGFRPVALRGDPGPADRLDRPVRVPRQRAGAAAVLSPAPAGPGAHRPSLRRK